MSDEDVLAGIQQLAAEEHELYDRHATGKPLTDDERVRLKDLEVRLDQCWDLLRQRRARREFGQDPSTSEVRDPSTVEGYRQ
jgi:Protein of unknown function (DUF2630)